MKAILVRQFGGPDVLKLEEVPTPKPAAGEVLVRIMPLGSIPTTPTCARVLILRNHPCRTLPDRMEPEPSRRLAKASKR
jgi:hypothetical protein